MVEIITTGITWAPTIIVIITSIYLLIKGRLNVDTAINRISNSLIKNQKKLNKLKEKKEVKNNG